MGILGITAVITGIIFVLVLTGAAGCDLARNLTDRADDEPPAKDTPKWLENVIAAVIIAAVIWLFASL